MSTDYMIRLRRQVVSCPKCEVKFVPKVMRSPAGFYAGTSCNCGPYSRESDYYRTREEVQKLLNLFGEE